MSFLGPHAVDFTDCTVIVHLRVGNVPTFTLVPTCSILVIHSLPEIWLYSTVYYSDVLKIHDKDTNDKPSLQGCANMQVNGCELI